MSKRKTPIQVFRRHSAAKKAANGRPILFVARTLYIVGIDSLDEAALISDKGQYCGNITMQHLNRLGNANWAVAGKGGEYSHFGKLNWELQEEQRHGYERNN